MKSMVALLVLGLSASVALADNARPRSGNSGSSSGSGARHSGASSSNNGSSGGSNVQRDRSSRSGSVSGAQARHPRAGTGTGDRFYGHGRGYYPYNYYGYPRSYAYFGYSPFWYGDYYFGYGGYGGYGYGGYGGYYGGYDGYPGAYYGPRAYYEDNRSSLRIQVQPEKATVYVDGYYAGVVDDFNGLFQRLNLSPGRHEVTVRMDGYRTHTWKIYAPSGQTIKLQYDLVKGDGADPVDELPGARPAAYQRESADPDYDRDAPSSRPMARHERASGDPGRVRLNFSPDDATVYIDGEFRGKAGQVQTVELSPGPHRVEVVRPGFVTYEREIEVQSGDNADLRVELEPRR